MKATPLIVAAGDKPNQGDNANRPKDKVGVIMMRPFPTNTSSRINPTKTSGNGHDHSHGDGSTSGIFDTRYRGHKGHAGGDPWLDESKSKDE